MAKGDKRVNSGHEDENIKWVALLDRQKKTVVVGVGIGHQQQATGQNDKGCQSRIGRREVEGKQQEVEGRMLAAVKTSGGKTGL